MAQRISRAKRCVRAVGVPVMKDWRSRLAAVLHVLYLIFSEGYASSSGGQFMRTDLSREAIRLTRLVWRLLPGETEVAGLLALMLLTDARRAARTGEHGELIPLTEQDRSLWDTEAITQGVALICATLPRGAVGPYQVQAAIAALHDEAPSTAATDWPQILALYTVMERIQPNPTVTLNRAVALAMVCGPHAGLELLSTLPLDHYRLAAVRGHLLKLAGDRQAALQQLRYAATHTPSIPEQRWLLDEIARLSS